MRRNGRADDGLRRLAVPAPVSAEFQQGQAGQRIDLGTGRVYRIVGIGHWTLSCLGAGGTTGKSRPEYAIPRRLHQTPHPL